MFYANLIARVLGATFIAFGLIGFIPHLIFAAHGLVATNASHNFECLLIGLAFLAGAWTDQARIMMVAIGTGYAAIAGLSFGASSDTWLGPIFITRADRWLYVILASAIFSGCWLSTQSDFSPKASTRVVK